MFPAMHPNCNYIALLNFLLVFTLVVSCKDDKIMPPSHTGVRNFVSEMTLLATEYKWNNEKISFDVLPDLYKKEGYTDNALAERLGFDAECIRICVSRKTDFEYHGFIAIVFSYKNVLYVAKSEFRPRTKKTVLKISKDDLNLLIKNSTEIDLAAY